MKIKWQKTPRVQNLALDWERIFILPTESSGCCIYYGDEFCSIEGVSVQELVDKLKAHDDIGNALSERIISKDQIKTMIEDILKEN